MTRNDADVDARLCALDPVRDDGRTPHDEPWARQTLTAITTDSSHQVRSPGRGVRWIRHAVPAVAVAAIVAMVAVLLINTDGGSHAPTPDRLVLLAAASATPDPAALEESARTVLARADLMGLEGVSAVRQADGLAIGLPAAADDDALNALVAPGRLVVLPYESAIVAAGLPSLDAAVRRAQSDAQAPVTGGDGSTLPDGYIVARLTGDPGVHGETPPTTFLVFRGRPAFTETDVAGAAVAPAREGPAVTLNLTDDGRTAFADLTRSLALSGRLEGRSQHVAIIVDGLLVARPAVDYAQYPGGIDPVNGVQIVVGSPSRADSIAAQLQAGPLPVDLTPVPGG